MNQRSSITAVVNQDDEYYLSLPNTVVNYAAEFGIKVHQELEKLCNHYIESKKWELSDDTLTIKNFKYNFILTKVVNLLVEKGIRAVRSEMDVAYVDDMTGKKFRGKIDLLARNAANEFILIDFKTCLLNEDVIEKATYQLGMYAMTLRQMCERAGKKISIAHHYILSVKKRGLPELIEVEKPEDEELMELLRRNERREEPTEEEWWDE